MKLKKRVVGKTFVPISEDERFHCCRYCHYYRDGKCLNKQVISSTGNSVFLSVVDVAESGKLSGVLEEAIHSCDTKEITSELIDLLKSWKISDKRVREFEQTFKEVFDQWADFTLKPEIDESVDRLYQNEVTDGDYSGIEISDPDTYYCKEWF